MNLEVGSKLPNGLIVHGDMKITMIVQTEDIDGPQVSLIIVHKHPAPEGTPWFDRYYVEKLVTFPNRVCESPHGGCPVKWGGVIKPTKIKLPMGLRPMELLRVGSMDEIHSLRIVTTNTTDLTNPVIIMKSSSSTTQSGYTYNDTYNDEGILDLMHRRTLVIAYQDWYDKLVVFTPVAATFEINLE